MNKINIYLDPSYEAFYENKIFDTSSSRLNRDNQLLPFMKLRESAKKRDCLISTADHIPNKNSQNTSYYYSLGLIPDFTKLKQKKVLTCGMVLMEPPVVVPTLYNALPSLATNFRAIFL